MGECTSGGKEQEQYRCYRNDRGKGFSLVERFQVRPRTLFVGLNPDDRRQDEIPRALCGDSDLL
jgi:hypothetical protein